MKPNSLFQRFLGKNPQKTCRNSLQSVKLNRKSLEYSAMHKFGCKNGSSRDVERRNPLQNLLILMGFANCINIRKMFIINYLYNVKRVSQRLAQGLLLGHL